MDQHLLLIADFDGDDDEDENQKDIILCPNCGFRHWQIDTFTYEVNGEDTGMSQQVYTCMACGYEESAYRE